MKPALTLIRGGAAREEAVEVGPWEHDPGHTRWVRYATVAGMRRVVAVMHGNGRGAFAWMVQLDAAPTGRVASRRWEDDAATAGRRVTEKLVALGARVLGGQVPEELLADAPVLRLVAPNEPVGVAW